MAGLRTNEVFYEDVKVPKENLVGKERWMENFSKRAAEGGPALRPATVTVSKPLLIIWLRESPIFAG